MREPLDDAQGAGHMPGSLSTPEPDFFRSPLGLKLAVDLSLQLGGKRGHPLTGLPT